MKKIAILGLSHGLNDCVSGFILGSLLSLHANTLETGLAVLMYNIIAFGGQIPVAIWFKNSYHPKLLLSSCFALLILSLLILKFDYTIAVLAAGISSAIIHVVGGYESSIDTKKAFGLGVFASPGVVGLILGGYWSFILASILMPAIIVALGLIIIVNLMNFENKITSTQQKQEQILDNHDLIMIVLLTVISMRSAIWNVYQVLYDARYFDFIYIGLSAGAGKLLGSWLSDQIGHRRYNLLALIISIPLLTFFKSNIVSMCAGIFLLQSTFPVTSRLLISHYKNNPFLGVAFSFGLPIVLGILIFYLPLSTYLGTNVTVVVLSLLSILLLFFEYNRYQMKIEK